MGKVGDVLSAQINFRKVNGLTFIQRKGRDREAVFLLFGKVRKNHKDRKGKIPFNTWSHCCFFTGNLLAQRILTVTNGAWPHCKRTASFNSTSLLRRDSNTQGLSLMFAVLWMRGFVMSAWILIYFCNGFFFFQCCVTMVLLEAGGDLHSWGGCTFSGVFCNGELWVCFIKCHC